MSTVLPGFAVPVRCYSDLSAVVQLLKADGTPFDLTGYSTMWSAVKQSVSDTAELFVIEASVSTVDNLGGTVTPDQGWVLLYAPHTETAKAQAIAKTYVAAKTVRMVIDLVGLDSFGNRIPLAYGYADVRPAVTETYT